MIKHKYTLMKKNDFALGLGFKNATEAICCLGSGVFNDQFKVYLGL